MLKMIAAGGVVASLLAAPATAQAAPTGTNPPDPGKMTIQVATVNGSGCPIGTAAVALAPDNTAFTVTYSNYIAQAGYGTRPIDNRKNCQLSLKINVPQGITYAIARADYRGYGSLASGATASQVSSYYFQGMSGTAIARTNFSGPFDNNWQTSDVTEVGALVYSPCGEMRNFNINTEVRVNAGTSNPRETSYMTMDSTDGSLNTIYRFTWKKCGE